MNESTTIDQLFFEDKLLHIDWTDGKTSTLAAIWLRDHCQMPASRDPSNGQRLFNITDIAPEQSIAQVIQLDNKQIEICYSPGGHRSIFSLSWLREHCYCLNPPFDDRCEQGKILWDKKNLGELSYTHYPDYVSDLTVKAFALRSVRDLGFVVFENVPCRDRELLKVIETFGYVRNTNYGELFDVRTAVSPNNLAYTNLGLGSHADNPYRDPVPSIQLLHCLENSVDGGESVLVDGFKAASLLREESPQHFGTLSTTWVNYRFCDENADLRSRAPMIEVDDKNQIVKVRYNNRSIAPINASSEKIESFYAAYRCFAKILERDALKLNFQMKAGDLMLFDNTRIMHARTAFSDVGTRHLQGAYSDLDGLYSTLSKLKRTRH